MADQNSKGFLGGRVDKGWFDVLSDDGADDDLFVFHLNPTEVEDSHPPKWASHGVPGRSHPAYQFGSGGERTIRFTLKLDGDVGHRNATERKLSIKDELDFLKRFSLPTKTLSSSAPPRRVFFSMGEMYQGVECILSVEKITVTYWTPKMEPVRADVVVTLKEYASSSQFASSQGKVINRGA